MSVEMMLKLWADNRLCDVCEQHPMDERHGPGASIHPATALAVMSSTLCQLHICFGEPLMTSQGG